jgi:hypothetical protein
VIPIRVRRYLFAHYTPETLLNHVFEDLRTPKVPNKRCGPVAYQLQLPETLSAVHSVFHVSQLKKCLRVPDRTIDVMDVTLEPDLTYSEHPIRILDQKDRITRIRTLKFYKIQWNQHTEDEATWETQDFLEKNFPGFLA